MEPGPNQLTYESSTSTGSAQPLAIATASAPTQGEIDSLEQARYLRLAREKKKSKDEADKYADFKEGDQKCG